MTNAVAARAETDAGGLIESVIVKGDLSKLTPQERTRYYVEVCKSIGLNPMTKPFEYITLNGKLTLYALRNCTDQLRTIHGVSVEELAESEREGVFIVTAKVRNKDGRTDVSKGAVTITGLKGDNLANALMKAETKAKRRATLSICGLGFLDETEVETIPNGRAQGVPLVPHDPETGEITPSKIVARDPVSWAVKFQSAVKSATSQAEIDQWIEFNQATLTDLATRAPAASNNTQKAIAESRAKIGPEREPGEDADEPLIVGEMG